MNISEIISSDAVQVALRVLSIATNTFCFLFLCGLMWFGCSFGLGSSINPLFNIHINGFSNVLNRFQENSNKFRLGQNLVQEAQQDCKKITDELEKERKAGTLTAQKLTAYRAQFKELETTYSTKLDSVYDSNQIPPKKACETPVAEYQDSDLGCP